LLLPGNRDYAVPATTTIPASYQLNVGDVVAISLNGSIDGSVEVEVNTDGKIFLPKVGPVSVIGVRYADLKQVISRAIGTQYRGYSVTVGISSLRGVRVYVTGFANNPGAYTVNRLSTLLNATLAAGGPSSGGSLRSVKLYRRGQEVADFDLYDLLLRGDRGGDAILQNEDVLFIPPLGEQIAITGSVNVEAVFEIKSGETIASAIAHAGGTNVLADVTRAMLYRAGNLEKMSGQEISLADQALFAVKGGDIIQLLTIGSLRRPIGLQTVVVRIEGEVNKPGNYIVPPNTDMAQIVELAGGYTRQAFVYGTKVERVSIKTQQQESYKEAIKQLEFNLLSAPLTSGRLDNSNRDIELSSARALLDQMRQAEPDGRLVLDVDPLATTLPGGLIMETNDRISIPPRPATIGVYGAVYRPASFALNPDKRVKVRDYIDRAGGELRAADRSGIFVVRASGDVISKRRGALDALVLPGDVVFVPVKSQSTSLLAKIREVSQVIFQLGVGVAAFVTLAR
jgi:protein involved in polysaccharide export with SLBB domain